VRADISKLHVNVEKFNQNFNEEFWTQYNKLLNDLKNVSSTLSGKKRVFNHHNRLKREDEFNGHFNHE
jgi:P2-related tail formation protein